MGKCVIFGAAAFDRLLLPIEKEDLVIAADGGLSHLEKLGHTPQVILGDFDSLGYVPAGAEVFPVEKDDTDLMLAVRCGLNRGFREFVIYGGLDGVRLDHTMSNYQTLSFLRSQNARGYLVGQRYLVTAIANETAVFPPSAAGILSVFALDEAKGVTLQGLQYTMDNGTLSPDFPLGVSNHFVGETAKISVNSGRLLLMWDADNGLPTIF